MHWCVKGSVCCIRISLLFALLSSQALKCPTLKCLRFDWSGYSFFNIKLWKLSEYHIARCNSVAYWAQVRFPPTVNFMGRLWAVELLAWIPSESNQTWAAVAPDTTTKLCSSHPFLVCNGKKSGFYEQRKIRSSLKCIVRGPITCRTEKEMLKENYCVYIVLCYVYKERKMKY
jgi:hypothetical protein